MIKKKLYQRKEETGRWLSTITTQKKGLTKSSGMMDQPHAIRGEFTTPIQCFLF